MHEQRFLEMTQEELERTREELESLREENEELKIKLNLHLKFLNDVEEILGRNIYMNNRKDE